MSHEEAKRLITTTTIFGGRFLAFAPPDSEACCLPVSTSQDDICIDLSPYQCVQAGGVNQGPGSTCDEADCSVPVMGVCCYEDGTCQEVLSDNCDLPNVFLPGQVCGPGICGSDCFFELTDCCSEPGLGVLAVIDCVLALALAGGAGFIFFKSDSLGTCFFVDLSDDPIRDVPGGVELVIANKGDLFPECIACCDGIGEPCPPPIPNYCDLCTTGILGMTGLTLDITNCGQGSLFNTLALLFCDETQSFQGTLDGTFGPPFVDPNGQIQPVQLILDCNGVTGKPAEPLIPNKWVLSIDVFSVIPGICEPWSFHARITAPRGSETVPDNAIFNEVEVSGVVLNNIDSYSIALDWNFLCD